MNKTAVKNVGSTSKAKERNVIMGVSSAVIVVLAVSLRILTNLWYEMEAFETVSVVHREIPLILLFMVSFAALVLIWSDHSNKEISLVNLLVIIPFVGWYLFELLFGLMSQHYFFFHSFMLAFVGSIVVSTLLMLGLELTTKKLQAMKVKERSPIFITWTALFTTIVLFILF